MSFIEGWQADVTGGCWLLFTIARALKPRPSPVSERLAKRLSKKVHWANYQKFGHSSRT